MSTKSRMQADFIQGNQSKVEHDSPQSALFYLFQEVSKLVSPIHNSFPDSDLPSESQIKAYSQDPLVIKKEEGPHSFETSASSVQDTLEMKKEGDAHSFHTCNGSCHHSLSCSLPCNELETVNEECQSSNVTTTSQCERNSPWKVLSLINLQCEKLLHLENLEVLDLSSASSATKLGYSTVTLSTAAPDVTEAAIESDTLSGECMLGPSPRLFERQEITPSVSADEKVTGRSTGDGFKLQCCVKDSEMGVQLETAETTDTDRADLPGDSTTASLHPQHKSKTEVNFTVNTQIGCSQECEQGCSSSKQDILNAPFFEYALSQAHNACLNTKLTCNSDDETCTTLSKPVLSLDINANLTLSVEAQCDGRLPPLSPIQLCSQSPSLTFSAPENSLFGSKPDECADAPIDGDTPPTAPIKSSAPSKAELWTMQKEDHGSSSHQWRTKTPRKQPRPSRSVDIQDPDFQGVTFRMDTELDESREQCRLLITSRYSKELCRSVRKPRLRTRSSQKSFKTSSSDEENGHTTSVLKGKVCASCCTRKTPMWRDAEDGTPLCNACGIRYKKYRVRCVNCWHIPRKEGNSNSCCLKCGNFVRLTSAQRKHTT
ncbi:GATA-type zinc finger protein 1 isoform X2 [Haplochromis burtoni]|nr:GATA-type zinc finger protein 1 isoform X2 [Haplochromis burtoni]